ncbi:MAG: hypothetical protein ABSF21_00040 [Dehalococcoidia bacterium]|jgi:hypothetical protein
MAILTAGAHVLTVPIIVSPGITWGGYVYLSTDALGANPVSGATGTIVTSPNKSNGLAQNISLPVNVPSNGGPFYAWVVVLLNGSFWGVYSQNELVSLPFIYQSGAVQLFDVNGIPFSDIGHDDVTGLDYVTLANPIISPTVQGISIDWLVSQYPLYYGVINGQTQSMYGLIYASIDYINQATGQDEIFRSADGVAQSARNFFNWQQNGYLSLPAPGSMVNTPINQTNIMGRPTLYVDEPIDGILTLNIAQGRYLTPAGGLSLRIKNLMRPS